MQGAPFASRSTQEEPVPASFEKEDLTSSLVLSDSLEKAQDSSFSGTSIGKEQWRLRRQKKLQMASPLRSQRGKFISTQEAHVPTGSTQEDPVPTRSTQGAHLTVLRRRTSSLVFSDSLEHNTSMGKVQWTLWRQNKLQISSRIPKHFTNCTCLIHAFI